MIRPESRAFVVLLGAIMMVNALSIDMMLPALPALGRELAATPDQVQLTLSLYLLGYAAGQLFCGPLADRFGRKPVLLGGLGIFSATALACASSPSIELLVAARVVQGFAGCSGPVIVRAMVRDHFGGSRAAQMLSSLSTVFAAGPLLAPIIGGALLVRFGWPAIFFFILAWGLVLLSAGWAGLSESLAQPDREALRVHRLISNYRTFLTTPICLGFALVNGFCWMGVFAFLSGSPFILIQHYGVAPEHYGYYFALTAVTIVLGATTNKRLLRHVSGHRVLRLGSAVLLLGGALTLLLPMTPLGGPLTVMLSVMVYLFGQALVMPNAMAGALEPLRHMAGTGSALIGVIQMICGSAGGYAVNRFYDGTPLAMGATILFAAVASTAVYCLMQRRAAA